MNINLSKWMEKISDNKPILSLDLPGAHDCATNYVQFSTIARCQNKDIYGLLSIGIRVLDVRVDIRDNSLVLVHSHAKALTSPEKNARQLEMSDVLKSIKRFLGENPTESVIFQFKNDSEKKMNECFELLYRRYISKEPSLWFTENRIPLINEVRGKIVLLRRCEMYASDKPYNAENSGIDLSRWINQSSRKPEPLLLKTFSSENAEFLIQDRYKYTAKEKWSRCLLPFLDGRKAFDGQYVICYTSTAGGIIVCPEKNAAYINRKFLSYPLEKDKYYGIIYFDFPSKEIIKKVIENNF